MSAHTKGEWRKRLAAFFKPPVDPLSASAPQMYDVLSRMVQAIDRGAEAPVNEARSVLAKARGEVERQNGERPAANAAYQEADPDGTRLIERRREAA